MSTQEIRYIYLDICPLVRNIPYPEVHQLAALAQKLELNGENFCLKTAMQACNIFDCGSLHKLGCKQ
jgi:hypothetical protein